MGLASGAWQSDPRNNQEVGVTGTRKQHKKGPRVEPPFNVARALVERAYSSLDASHQIRHSPVVIGVTQRPKIQDKGRKIQSIGGLFEGHGLDKTAMQTEATRAVCASELETGGKGQAGSDGRQGKAVR